MLDLNNNSLYREIIMEHAKHPKNAQLQENLQTWSIKNPLCGDSISVQIQLNENKTIKAIYHKSIGCSISMSSSSVMSELLAGKTIPQAIKIINAYVHMVKGLPYDKNIDLGDAIVYSGVQDYPARFKCATVSWEVVLNALQELQKTTKE